MRKYDLSCSEVVTTDSEPRDCLTLWLTANLNRSNRKSHSFNFSFGYYCNIVKRKIRRSDRIRRRKFISILNWKIIVENYTFVIQQDEIHLNSHMYIPDILIYTLQTYAYTFNDMKSRHHITTRAWKRYYEFTINKFMKKK